MNSLSRKEKSIILITIDLLLLFVAMFVTMYFIQAFASINSNQLLTSYLVVAIDYLVIASWFKIFSILNRFTDYRVLFYLMISLAISYSLLAVVVTIVYPEGSYSYRFVLLSFLFSTFLLIAPRLLWRELNNSHSRKKKKWCSRIRTLVVGAEIGRAHV